MAQWVQNQVLSLQCLGHCCGAGSILARGSAGHGCSQKRKKFKIYLNFLKSVSSLTEKKKTKKNKNRKILLKIIMVPYKQMNQKMFIKIDILL